jgi:GntR family transcriptional regulator
MAAGKVDQRSPVPAYRQLADILQGQIESGRLPRDRRLPRETTLIQEDGVARGTVRRAIAVLR